MSKIIVCIGFFSVKDFYLLGRERGQYENNNKKKEKQQAERAKKDLSIEETARERIEIE